MSRSTGPTAAEAYELARKRGLLGLWLITHTPVRRPYPCRCSKTRNCYKTCSCHGRTDLETVPVTCCARRAVPVVEIEPEDLGRAA